MTGPSIGAQLFEYLSKVALEKIFFPTQPEGIASNSKKPQSKNRKSIFFESVSTFEIQTAGDVIFVFEINNRVYPSMAC